MISVKLSMDFFKILDMPPDVVSTLYVLCNRASMSECLANIPFEEQPAREDLQGYMAHYASPEDLAWSDLYPQLVMWLNDREERKKHKERDGASPGLGLERFNL